MKKLTHILLLLLLLLGSQITIAENNQTFVIGISSGIHNFSKTDDLRNNMVFGDLGIAGASNIYLEWYAFEELGIGLRSNTLGIIERVGTWFSITDRELMIRNSFITLNWVPFGATSYTRFGLVAGLGNSRYDYSERVNGATIIDSSSTGNASLLGGFVDWGGEDFGARFSLNLLNTDLDDLNGHQVDASGSSWNLDLRWAFN